MHDSPQRSDYSPPEWVLGALEEAPETSVSGGRYPIRSLAGERFALLSITVPAAAELGADELEATTRESYLRLLDHANRLRASHLFRVWNLIPRILEPLGELPHRYLAFNAGRFHAYRAWYGERFHEHAPTASGVGAPGNDLVIHALASADDCRPLQNPRQRPSYQYSNTYGACPPCFARAVLVFSPGDQCWLVVGGTASVRGEETVHSGNLEAQANETLLNLASLVDVGHGRAVAGDEIQAVDVVERLDRFQSLRVYYVEDASLFKISAWVDTQFRKLQTVEYVRTELCRDDLLIEIEGVAELDFPPDPELVGPA